MPARVIVAFALISLSTHFHVQVSNLRSAHYAGASSAGIDITRGTVGDMKELGILEPLKLKLQVLLSAAEAAEMILRVDETIKCAPRKRDADMRH